MVNARKIIDTRNKVIHGYDTVSDEIIWAIVIRELGNLETGINLLLEQ
ncbi:MAG TPA: HepT-like ribonuclease domain-containing protein [Bacteroidia bacterium]|nr:HepT-like ribonuclease domain-containing protein [Bacteroidia bacterium]